ncbi:unnamed protein product [Euphydryas editha]|uniref:Uncharacterized protein n=1 Tax=Euphydryas editha TaxID=104508 RepID=A0AAU9UNF5_EUPED|nr:unnamed protein product [Euphydryas editha]
MSNNIKVFKNISIIQNLNFNSDHRMVCATLTCDNIKRNRRWQNNSSALMCTGNSDTLISNLTSLVERFEGKTIPIKEKYKETANILKTETRKINKRVTSTETQQLLEERKKLLEIRENSQERRKK